jgi:hypothetical protein
MLSALTQESTPALTGLLSFRNNMKNAISEKLVDLKPDQIARRDEIVAELKLGFRKLAAGIQEIVQDKLYLGTHTTAKAFFESIGISESYAYGMIKAGEAVDGLLPSLSGNITNERQARALLKVPAESRNDVVKEALKSGDALTGKSIIEASEKVKNSAMAEPQKHGKTEESRKTVSEKEPEEPRDKTGFVIPERLRARWEENSDLISKLMRSVSDVRTTIREAVETVNKANTNGSNVWAPINLSDVSVNLDNAYRALKLGQPFAVCPFCQGMGSKSCTVCKQLGYLSKFIFEGPTVPDDLRKLREKSCKK